MRPAAGAAMHRLAVVGLAVIMLGWMVAGALAYFDADTIAQYFSVEEA